MTRWIVATILLTVMTGRPAVARTFQARDDGGPERAARQTITYREVAPLLNDRCAMCHHPNGPAPFPLLTYDDAKRHAQQIARVAGTISYNILCSISARVRRVYV